MIFWEDLGHSPERLKNGQIHAFRHYRREKRGIKLHRRRLQLGLQGTSCEWAYHARTEDIHKAFKECERK
jgi:hypothetical protein